MAQGRIVQAASARVIYAEPDSSYVARFMGGQNVLSGTVQSLAGGIGTLAAEGGGQFAVRFAGRAAPIGHVVEFAVRRDRIHLSPVGAADVPKVNAVTGVLRAVEYQGTYVKATLVPDAGPEFVVYVDEGEYFRAPIALGTRATGWWDMDEAHLLLNA
jgi:putative spermidine/putrescine transport system ATP-binding protein